MKETKDIQYFLEAEKKFRKEHPDYVADLDWMCFSKGPYEFD